MLLRGKLGLYAIYERELTRLELVMFRVTKHGKMWGQDNLRPSWLSASWRWSSNLSRFHNLQAIQQAVISPTTITRQLTLSAIQTYTYTMAPKRAISGRGAPRAPQGFFASTYDTLTSSENAAMVRSIGVFAVSASGSRSEWLNAYLRSHRLLSQFFRAHGASCFCLRKRSPGLIDEPQLLTSCAGSK